MKHTPLTRQSSPWVADLNGSFDFGDGIISHVYRRDVHDGRLAAIVGHEPLGPDGALRWHLSISHGGKARRYPTWDEQVHAVRELCPPGITFHMVLPPDDDGYVALHDTTFHWHEYREGE